MHKYKGRDLFMGKVTSSLEILITINSNSNSSHVVSTNDIYLITKCRGHYCNIIVYKEIVLDRP